MEKLNTLQTENTQFRKDVDDLRYKNSELEKRVNSLENKADAAEQYSRCNCLRVAGKMEPTGDEKEDTDHHVIKPAYDLGVELVLNDIERSHSVGKPRTDGRPRDIIVKFASYDNIANKLKTDSISSKQWWTVLKSFIAPNYKFCISPLEYYGAVYSDDHEKANIIYDFFRDQTVLDDRNAVLPDISSYPIRCYLDSINITPDEVKSVLRCLPLGKSPGSDAINNRFLREIAREFHPLYRLLYPVR